MRATILCVLTYLCGLMLLRPWLFSRSTTGFYGGDRFDGGLYVWLVRVLGQNHVPFLGAGFELPIFYPFSRALAYTDNFLLPALVVRALRGLGGSEIFTYNLVLLVAMLLNGVMTFGLLRQCKASIPASLVAGFGFMLLPFLAIHHMHPQLQFAFFLPSALWGTLSFLDSGSVQAAVAIGVSILGAFLCSVYYAVFAVLLVGLVLLFAFPTVALLRRPAILFRLAIGTAPFAAILLLLLQPYLAVREAFGSRPLVEFDRYSSSLFSYLAAPPESIIWGKFTHSMGHFEAYLFPGGLILLFAGIGMFSKALPLRTKGILSAALLFFVFASTGGWLFVQLRTWIPGIDVIRASGRLGVVSCVLLSVFAGLGFDRACTLFARTQARKFICCLVVLLLIGAELRVSQPSVAKGSPRPPIEAELQAQPASAFIALPLHTAGKGGVGYSLNLTEYMNWYADLPHFAVHGYSGNMPKFHQRLPKRLAHFPDRTSLFQLSRIVGLSYIVFHPAKQTSFNRQDFEAKLLKHADQLEILAIDEQGNYLLRLRSKIALPKSTLLVSRQLLVDDELNIELRIDSTASAAHEVTVSHRDANERASVLVSTQWVPLKLTVADEGNPVIPVFLELESATLPAESSIEYRIP